MTGRSRRGPLLLLLLGVTACGPTNPCAPSRTRRLARVSLPYAGHWVVVHGDTLTFPQMGDRFKLTDIVLDTTTVVAGKRCMYTGALKFSVPRESLAVGWVGQPGQAFIYGWPADLGPFGGIGATLVGDSLRGAILFDSRMGVAVQPGVTAQFVAARKR